MTETLIQDIVSVSVRNNSELDITGILLFADGAFMQVLEGPKALVGTTIDRIVSDTRHSDVTINFRGGVGSRAFPDWHMKAASLSSREIEGVRELGTAQMIFDPIPKPFSPEIDFYIRGFLDGLQDQAA